MIVADMDPANTNAILWWIAIGVLFVVVTCVIVLLSLVTAFVKDIDENVDVVAGQLIDVSANTKTSTHVHETAGLVNTLIGEVGEHIKALERIS